MGTISGVTHIKTLFSFFPDIGEHFIGNTVCCITHILHSHDKHVLQTCRRKIPDESNLENEGPRNGSPTFTAMIRKLLTRKAQTSLEK
jgi:hypothetical protein